MRMHYILLAACLAFSLSWSHFQMLLQMETKRAGAQAPWMRLKKDFKHDICILTMVRANGVASRDCQRSQCRPTYNQSIHKFVVGIPSYTNAKADRKAQGEVADEKEVQAAEQLLKEQATFQDLVVTPHRDYYQDLTQKRLGILKWGVENKCNYIVKIDDEYCMNLTNVQQAIATHEEHHPNDELYLGSNMWNGTEYPTVMTGPHGEHVRYMSGLISVISYKVASYIVNEDWTHSVLSLHYGTSSEDMNFGHWVKHTTEMHNVSVKYVVDTTIADDFFEGTCKEPDATLKQ